MFGPVGTNANAAMARLSARQEGNVGATLEAATAFDVQQAAGLQMLVPSTSEVDETVYPHVSDKIDGDYLPLYGNDGQVSFAATQGLARDLPEAMFACHFVKFVGDNTFPVILLAKT